MARASFVVNIADVLRQPGAQFPLQLHGTVAGAALSTAAVPDDATVVLDATIEAQGKMVVVQGTVGAPWVGECRRCLDPAGGDLQVDLREVFEPNPVDGETYPIDGEQIDLAPVLRDVLALALPLAPLCRDDCIGPDPDPPPVTPAPDEADAEAAPPADPRWAALDQLHFDS